MGLLTKILAATPENPRFGLNDPNAWNLFLAGNTAATGVVVSRDTALTFSPWWRGVNLIARDVGKLPFQVKKLQASGKQPDRKHPAYALLYRKPNRYQTALQFRLQLTSHAVAGGNGYAHIVRDGGGRPVELLPMSPDVVTPVREIQGDQVRLWYVVQVRSENRKLMPEDVLHVKGMGYDGLVGHAPYEYGRESIGLGLAAAKFGSIYFRNAGRPSIVLQHPGRIKEETAKRLRLDWERMHAGLDNAHRTAILEEGMEAKEISANAKDAELAVTREFQIRDVANFLCVPPHKLGDDTRTSYSSLEQENTVYLTEGLDFWLVNWEHECDDKLLAEEEKDDETHACLFDRRQLLRADMVARSTYFRTALGGAAWMSVDEVRGDEGLEASGQDEVVQPLNMGKPGGNPDTPPPPVQTPAPPPPKKQPTQRQQRRQQKKQAAIAALLADARARAVKRFGQHALRAAKKADNFLAWLDAAPAEHLMPTVEILGPALAVAGDQDPRDEAAHLIEALAAGLLEVAGQARPAELAAAVERWLPTAHRPLEPDHGE